MDRFPHRGFCEEQFLALMQTGTAYDVGILPNLADLWGWKLTGAADTAAGFRPEVWGIQPTRQDNETIGLSQQAMVFTAQCEKGTILVCTLDVLGNLNTRPEADYLFHILLEHALGMAPRQQHDRS